MREARDAYQGEPDGYDGISRRGHYERLLLSEWLLADLEPIEFLRRASEGEHNFHSLRKQDPVGGRASLLLFDVGPDQRGAPRLAHLAFAIAFQLRAQRAHAELLWGLLQHPGQLQRDFGREQIRTLLAKRTLQYPRSCRSIPANGTASVD